MVYIECAKTAGISHGTSHVIGEQSCKYTTWVDIQNAPQKASHLFKITLAPYVSLTSEDSKPQIIIRITCDTRAVSLLVSGQ